MVVFNNALAGAAGSGGSAGYTIDRSLRFNSGDSSHLKKIFGSDGTLTAWTLSCWVKRSALGTNQMVFTSGDYGAGAAARSATFRFGTGDNLEFQMYKDGGATLIANWVTTQVFRDPSAWQHLVLVYDSSNGTAADRARLYVNGIRVTAFASTPTYPSPSQDSAGINTTGPTHYFGGFGGTSATSQFLNANLADVHFLDGLTPGTATDDSDGSVTGTPNAEYLTDFGEFDATTGAWNPIAYSGSYGTNGFHLDFSDNSSASALGTDSSGNGNDWTANNFTPLGQVPESDEITSVSSTTQPNYTSQTNMGTNGSGASYLFNGVLTNSVQGFYRQTQTATFGNLPTASTSLRIYCWPQTGAGNWVVNGTNTGIAYIPNVWGWVDLSSLCPITVTSLSTSAGATSELVAVSGIEVDGLLLVDNAVVTTLTLSSNTDLAKFSPYDAVQQDDAAASGPVSSVDTGANTIKISPSTGTWSANTGNYVVGPDTRADTDSLFDSPTNGDPTLDTGLGGELSGNYCTWNPLTLGTYANGNLDATNTTNEIGTGTIGVSSGKWYWEITKTDSGTTHTLPGVTPAPYLTTEYVGRGGAGYGLYFYNGNLIYNDGSSGAYGAFSQNDILNVALDLDNGKLWFGKNGTWFNSGNPAAGTNALGTGLTGTWYPAISSASNPVTTSANFGQRPFANSSVPTGFKALCTANLPTPDIADGSTAFDVVTYTGNGTSQAVTLPGTGFKPEFVWLKARNDGADHHHLFDAARGVGVRWFSNLANAENTDAQTLQSFDTTGFTVGSQTAVNQLNDSMVGWCWDGGTAFSNTAGTNGATLDSTGYVNQDAGFSIVSWTGNFQTAQIYHGLDKAPEFIIVKNRDEAYDPAVYTKATGNAQTLYLDGTNNATSASLFWASTSPAVNVFTVGAHQATNNSTKKMIAYCWTSREGYSSIGTYEATSTADGPFVYTGFRPKWLMVKNIDDTTYSSAYNWTIVDTSRYLYNEDPGLNLNALFANSSSDENTYTYGGAQTGLGLDILSNGFKLRAGAAEINNGNTYVYIAFAENPFKYARAR